MRVVLEPWLGHGQYESSQVAPKLKFQIEAEGGSGVPIRLKIKTNISEIETYDPPIDLPFGVTNPWFTGDASVPTFSREEMLATKLRALLQREKGCDLYDLAHGLETFQGLDTEKVADFFSRYVALSGQVITRAQAEERMFAKLARPRFLTDMMPLLPTQQTDALNDQTTLQSFTNVFTAFIERLPGDTWLRTAEMRERFDVV